MDRGGAGERRAMSGEGRILHRWTSGWAVTLAAIAAVAMMAACGSDEPDTAATATALATASEEARASASPTSEPTSTPATPTAGAAAAATSAPEPTATTAATAAPTETPVEGYSSNSAMHSLISNLSRESFYDSSSVDEPLAAIRENGDVSLVPVMIDLMRFLGGVSGDAMIAVLEELTGQAFGGDWNQWMEWLGQNSSDYTPPDDYPDWKVALYSMIHPRFANFLRDGETARIDLAEVTWGGVVPDGIPDLRNPKTLTVAEAEYMNPDDRVFGVSINGEQRAYPLRIINAHEMANDIVGGEPISVMW